MMQDTGHIFSPIKEELICFHNTSTTELIDPTLPYHRHDAYEVYLFLRGNSLMYLEQSCYKLVPGDLILIRPGELHRCICLDTQTYERIGLNIRETAMNKLSSRRSSLSSCFESHAFGKNNLTRLTQEQIVYYTGLAAQLIACLRSEEYGQDILAEAYAAQLLVFINTLYRSSTHSPYNIMPELVSNTMSYIKSHLAEDISSGHLEQEFHYSSKYISRLFREHTGLTIRSYIIDQRVSLAKSHLAAGKSVADACELSGFSDYANFIRSFKKSAGISPGKYKAIKHTVRYRNGALYGKL
ncbi:helix-turn-helix transcriptional regulator [Paenibacillus tepidiphilus]|uniref:helix-turn-helix transcriptional regulator n=1 Tax=Paenibacillus tepidiphilus TaxID=2608683 RepID=UPI0013A5AD06|nr:AraC family transcriptional regulator [Paenibacillus tepidiphilus]